MIEILNGIKEKLGKISSLASNLQGINGSRSDHKSEDAGTTPPTETPVNTSLKETDQAIEEPIRKFLYCPECGHRCKGRRGLKIHTYTSHKDMKEEILETIELYQVQNFSIDS